MPPESFTARLERPGLCMRCTQQRSDVSARRRPPPSPRLSVFVCPLLLFFLFECSSSPRLPCSSLLPLFGPLSSWPRVSMWQTLFIFVLLLPTLTMCWLVGVLIAIGYAVLRGLLGWWRQLRPCSAGLQAVRVDAAPAPAERENQESASREDQTRRAATWALTSGSCQPCGETCRRVTRCLWRHFKLGRFSPSPPTPVVVSGYLSRCGAPLHACPPRGRFPTAWVGLLECGCVRVCVCAVCTTVPAKSIRSRSSTPSPLPLPPLPLACHTTSRSCTPCLPLTALSRHPQPTHRRPLASFFFR